MDGIRIELDYAAIEKLEKAVLRAVEETVDELRSDVVKEQVMPYDSGDMQNNSTFAETFRSDGKIVSLLTTDAPQARRLYYHPEYNFQTVNNPNAGGLWLEPWQPGGRRECRIAERTQIRAPGLNGQPGEPGKTPKTPQVQQKSVEANPKKKKKIAAQ